MRFWIKRFLTAGCDALPDQPHVGQPSGFTPALREAVRQELGQQERTWTAPQLADWLAAQHGVRLSPAWYRFITLALLAHAFHHGEQPGRGPPAVDRAGSSAALARDRMAVGAATGAPAASVVVATLTSDAG